MSRDITISTSEFLPPAREDLRRVMDERLAERGRAAKSLDQVRRKLTKIEADRGRRKGEETANGRLIREALAAEHDRLSERLRALDVEVGHAEQAVKDNVALRSLAEFTRVFQALSPRLRAYLQVAPPGSSKRPLVAVAPTEVEPWRTVLYSLCHSPGGELERKRAVDDCIAAFKQEGLAPWSGGFHE